MIYQMIDNFKGLFLVGLENKNGKIKAEFNLREGIKFELLFVELCITG